MREREREHLTPLTPLSFPGEGGSWAFLGDTPRPPPEGGAPCGHPHRYLRAASRGFTLVEGKEREGRGSGGFTLLEAVIGVAILGLVVGPLLAALSLSLTLVPRDSAKLTVENRHQLARYWLTRDANSAEDFTTGTGTTYGTFTWRDFSGESTNTYAVRYYYDSTLKALMREEKKNNVIQQTFQIAADILLVGDVTFTWSPGQRKVTVTVKPTIQEALAVGDVSRTATLVAFLRFEGESSVAQPGATPVPTPVPGSVTYLVAALPTVLVGTYQSGNAASLTTDDTDYYQVLSTASGTRTASYEVFSQTMNEPATIGAIEVRWTGQVNKKTVTMGFFVKTSSGDSYSATADASFTFTQTNLEQTASFFLSGAQVSGVNTSRVVFLKVTGTSGSTYTLSSNQLIFVASP